MTERARPDAERDEPADLEPAEREAVDERKAPSARVVHETVRQEGADELERPTASLLWSGAAAGVAMWLSVIAQGALTVKLPASPWAPAIVSLGYSVGFLVAILGRMQLFTESTIVAVLPLATKPSWASLGRTLRLWGLVFAANLAGTLAVALLLPRVGLVSPELLAAMVEVSHHAASKSPLATFQQAIPAGFVLAAIAWLLPNARGQQIGVVVLLTYVIALAGFSHVVAGSAEAWLLAVAGETGWWQAIGGFILPALAGNIIGGTGLFAALAHAQVRSEL